MSINLTLKKLLKDQNLCSNICSRIFYLFSFCLAFSLLFCKIFMLRVTVTDVLWMIQNLTFDRIRQIKLFLFMNIHIVYMIFEKYVISIVAGTFRRYSDVTLYAHIYSPFFQKIIFLCKNTDHYFLQCRNTACRCMLVL